ncbi:hypothetical protein BR93DRAFT_977434 [Coniochaeta sp. PMI_546]|nr:hypothetical protein BR93DRAFT_977434 [Coniochaeta sp. PMI_546]
MAARSSNPEQVVGVEDAIDKWAGKVEVIPRRPESGEEPTQRSNHRSRWVGHSQVILVYHLPAAPGQPRLHRGRRCEVFSSYINNLHPTKYFSIYKGIEKLIETALPLWDQCLAQYQGYRNIVCAGRRHDPRIVQDNAGDENEDNWDPNSPGVAEEGCLPERRQQQWNLQDKLRNLPSKATRTWGRQNSKARTDSTITETSLRIYPSFFQPPPFSKSRVNHAVNPGVTLRSQFKETGLQIIVNMASIELPSEKPEFPPGGWHVEGHMNEHMVGTALFCLDSESITDSHLDFRVLTGSYQDD